ncbi:MAG: PIN domain-containing protein [Calditrichaeota bacterium]|nr:MAG: PIN domain-containing protein [Calditrichota bacterium]
MPEINSSIIVFFDADALIAGSASREGASFILLHLSELGLIHGFTCQKVVEECHKNLLIKLPDAQPAFEKILTTALTITENPSKQEIMNYEKMADEKDLPILIAALKTNAQFLVTFNIKDFFPDPSLGLEVLKPGDLLKRIRTRLRELAN